MKFHLVGGNLNNTHGMEYYTMKALEAEGVLGPVTSYRLEKPKMTSMRIRDMNYDVLFVIKGEMVDPSVVYATPQYSILWYQDDIFATNHGQREIQNLAWAYDMVYSFDNMAMEAYQQLGARHIKWLPLAADLEVHKPLDMPKEYNVSMVGHMFPNRQSLAERLSKRFDKTFFGTSYDKYHEIVAKSKINLNLGIGKTGIQMRVFEVLAMGGFLMSGNIMDEGKIFEDRKHLVYFDERSIEDLIEYYLTHDKEREEIAECGHREVLEKHTYRHRVRQIIEDAEVWMNRND